MTILVIDDISVAVFEFKNDAPNFRSPLCLNDLIIGKHYTELCVVRNAFP